MLRIRKAQNEEFLQRVFRAKLYRFLCQVLKGEFRARVKSLAEVSAIWSKVVWPPRSSEHDIAVYMTFVLFSNFDPQALFVFGKLDEAIIKPGAVFAMKSYMAEAGFLDICAFDRVTRERG